MWRVSSLTTNRLTALTASIAPQNAITHLRRGMPRLGKTESNLLIKFILPRRDFALSRFDKRSHPFPRNSP